MAGNGIFGGGRGRGARNSAEQVKRREIWLVVLGIFLHAVYMLSIFDIYFKTPIVHGTDPVPQRITAPAKRLVLLVADGLRADKFFEPDSEGRFRAPFLRSVIKERGRWGVSHARPPTESRPGHVAIIAGFYEDPSAVTKGWKANPVEFDSVFNRSQHTFAYGSPDIIPIFCGALPHCTWNSYPHEFEDFAADASFLDHWSYDELEHLLNRSNHDLTLQKLLKQDKLVIFLHLLGCDTNGHAHRPFSSIYLNNVKVVDHIAASVYNLMENYFGDNQTAYIFTADHGMSDKGSHGDGHPTNTDTPLVAWGAGIRTPKRASRSSKPSDNFHFVDEHSHDMPTPLTWDLDKIERVDVNQADIAPLMATLVGLPCPINSVGNLPLEYLNLTKADEVEADLANTKQILNQCLRKSQLKQSTSFHFKPFKPLENFALVLHQIEDYISKEAYEAAMELSQNLRRLSLSGLHYFQTYDWLMLMTAVTLGYVGWIINLVIHLVQSYTSLDISKTKDVVRSKYSIKVYLGGCLAVSLFSLFLFIEKSPILYHAYVMMTLFLWMRIFSHFWILIAIWKYFCRKGSSSLLKHLLVYGVAIIISEFLVSSFSERRMYTWFFLIVGPIKALHLYNCVPQRISMAVFIGVSCWLLSVFTLMPAEIPDNTSLVITSGALVILIGAACKVTERRARADKLLSYISLCDKQPCRVPYLFFIQGTLVGLSSIMVWICSSRRSQKKELLLVHQIMNWSIIGISMVLPLFSPAGLLSRLNSIFLGFAPPFLLLSIGYESLFYGAFALVLVSWVLSESAILYPASARRLASDIDDSLRDIVVLSHEERNLQLSDIRIPLTFMVLFNVAFFGTGNFASIASFEISSVYRFITIFNPFLMAGLLIFKLFIPFMLVICVFSAITKLIHLPRIGCYFLVILFSDVMTIHFFFLVRNTGSWMEIGNSISHFGIMSAQVIFVLFLFALTNIYTRDIVVVQNHFSSRKAT